MSFNVNKATNIGDDFVTQVSSAEVTQQEMDPETMTVVVTTGFIQKERHYRHPVRMAQTVLVIAGMFQIFEFSTMQAWDARCRQVVSSSPTGPVTECGHELPTRNASVPPRVNR